MTRTFCAVHPVAGVGRRVGGGVGVEPGGDGRAAQLVHRPPRVDASDDGCADRVQDEPGFGAALGGLERDRVRDPLGQVAVGGGADVPSVQGMLDQSFPDLLLQLEPVPFRHALLNPPDQDRGGVDALDVGGLVGGEQRDSLPGQFLFEFQRVEHVPAGPFDVFADDRGEPGLRAGGLGQQVGHAAVAGQPGVGELLPVPALAAVLQVDAAGFDVPVDGGDEPARGQPVLGGAELATQGGAGVLQCQGGGPADERDRDRLGRDRPGRDVG